MASADIPWMFFSGERIMTHGLLVLFLIICDSCIIENQIRLEQEAEMHVHKNGE